MISYAGHKAEKDGALACVALSQGGDVVGIALLHFDRIETHRNGKFLGRARSIDDALRQAINAEKVELRRRR